MWNTISRSVARSLLEVLAAFGLRRLGSYREHLVHTLSTGASLDRIEAVRRAFDLGPPTHVDREILTALPPDRAASLVQSEGAGLDPLLRVLGFRGRSLERHKRIAAAALVSDVVGQAARTRKISDEVATRAIAIATAGGITPGQFSELLYQSVGPVFRREMDAVYSKGMLSPEDEARLNTLANDLRIELETSTKDEDAREQLRLLWRIKHDVLPVLPSNLDLEKGETAHRVVLTLFTENRARTKGTKYAATGASNLVLTNRRLLLNSPAGAVEMPVRNITRVECFRDGIIVHIPNSRPRQFQFAQNDVVFGQMLRRVISDATQAQTGRNGAG